MKVLRFALPALCLLGVAVCLNALARLAGLAPPSKLPPYPAWTAIHFVAAAAFAAAAPVQLWLVVTRRNPRLHRILGRAMVADAVVMATSGYVIAWLAPERPTSERILMSVLILAFAGMLALGVRAAATRDFAAHRTWMARMLATAFAALTQRLVFPIFAAAIGVHGRAEFWELFISAAWVGWGLNLAVAEWWLRRDAPASRLAAAHPAR
jgi:uncharacterized membrane protein